MPISFTRPRKTATNGGVVMVCFLPGYLTGRGRVALAAWDAEKARLRGLYQDNSPQFKDAMAAWHKEHPDGYPD